jgi:hypothetical protein
MRSRTSIRTDGEFSSTPTKGTTYGKHEVSTLAVRAIRCYENGDALGTVLGMENELNPNDVAFMRNDELALKA